jgi:DNA polymerase-3 subunit beta
MRFVVINAKALAAAARLAAKATPARNTIPIVDNLKLEVSATTLTVDGTDLDIMHTATVEVVEAEPGAVTVPGRRFADLIERLPPTAEVTVKVEDQVCAVSAGRRRWKFPTLPAEDFPVLEGPDAGADAASLTWSKTEAARLVRRLAHAISTEKTRYYLNGVFLHRLDGRLVGAATNGHVLATTTFDIDPGEDLAVIAPAKAITALHELAIYGDVEVKIDHNKISMRSGARTVTSKLIDGDYPDYRSILPTGKIKNSIEVSTTDLKAAVERHKAAAEIDTAVGLTWANGSLTTCLSRNEDGAVEELDGISASGKGRVAASADHLLDAIKALDAKTVLIEHAAPSTPIRFTRTDEPGTVLIVMPMSWAPPVINDEPAPPSRTCRGK